MAAPSILHSIVESKWTEILQHARSTSAIQPKAWYTRAMLLWCPSSSKPTSMVRTHLSTLISRCNSTNCHIVSFVGQRRTTLVHPQGLWTETYVGDVPDLMIRLLRMHTELGGHLNLSSDTGFECNVQFKDKVRASLFYPLISSQHRLTNVYSLFSVVQRTL